MSKKEKSTVTVSVPGPSAEEYKISQVAAAVAQQQLNAITATADYQNGIYSASEPLFGDLIETTYSELQKGMTSPDDPSLDIHGGQQGELSERFMELIRNGGQLSGAELENIDRLASETSARAGDDIAAGAKAALVGLREELAPSRGLRSTDTPILDRGAVIGAEATRQYGQAVRDANITALQSKIQLPYQKFAQGTQAILGEQGQLSAQNQFAQNLVQNAFLNRLQFAGDLTKNIGTLGLGLATGIRNDAGTIEAQMLSARVGAASRSTTGFTQDWGALAGAGGQAGGAAIGAAAAAIFA